MSKIIPYGNHYFDKKDKKELINSLKLKLVSSGPNVISFEKKLKNFFKTKFVLTTSSATTGLDLAFRCIKLKKGDVVLMPSINFIAAYNMAFSQGAKIILVDVDKLTGQLTPQKIVDCIKKNNLKKIKCLVTMYLGGSPENVIELKKLKKKYNFVIIEDACHALGSSFLYNKKNYKVGSNINSDISVFSFHPVKSIATGEGGCITTRNSNYYQTARKLKNHGIKRTNFHWDYDIQQPGFNYRLSDINCSLGISQLGKINNFLLKRNQIAKFYNKNFTKLYPYILLPNYEKKNFSSYHLYIFSINFDLFKTNKDHFFKYMLNKKIIFQYHYKPIYTFSMYKNKKNLKDTEIYFKNSVSAPIYYKLNIKQQKYIVKEVQDYIKKFKLKN